MKCDVQSVPIRVTGSRVKFSGILCRKTSFIPINNRVFVLGIGYSNKTSRFFVSKVSLQKRREGRRRNLSKLSASELPAIDHF
jgi:hypothetical protein